MESYSTIPSFTSSSASSAKDYEMKYNMNTNNFELTLEDGNNTLKYFNFFAFNVSVQRNENKLILSAPTEKQFDTITIKANKNLPKDVLPSLIYGTPEFWLIPAQQNFASLDVSGSREAVTAYFKLHTEKIGTHKKTVIALWLVLISSVSFGVYNNLTQSTSIPPLKKR